MAELRMPAVDFFGMFSALGDTIEKAREEAATRRTLASLFGDMPQQQQAAPVAQPSPTISGPARQQSLPTVAAMQGVPTGTRFDDIFRSASGKYGLPEGYLARTAQIESQLDPNAKNPNSSAGGLFQFIDGTARQYGLANRFDPAAATDAAARLASDNRGVLRRALGRDPTPGELYLAHQQGAGNAAKLLANPDAPASAVLGEQAFRLNGGRAGMTAAQFASKWTGKFGSGEGAQVAQATASDGPLPVPAGEYLANRQASRDAAQQAAPQSIAPAVASNAPQFGGVNPAMVKALVMNKGTRQIGMQLMQSMLSPKTSPYDFMTVGENMVRVNKQTGAAEVLPGLGKQVDPLDRSLKEVQLEKARRDLGTPNTEIIKDPSTGEILSVDRNNPAAGVRTLREAGPSKDAPTTRQIKQPDGSEVVVQWNSENRKWEPMQAPEGGAAVRAPNKLTEQQSKDIVYYNRGRQALETLGSGDILASGYEAGKGAVPLVGNYLTSGEFQKAKQASTNFLTSILRKDTGAAITNQEHEIYGRIFLPQPGDAPETLAQKAQARAQALDAIRDGLGLAEVLAIGERYTQRNSAAPSSAIRLHPGGATTINGVKIERIQ